MAPKDRGFSVAAVIQFAVVIAALSFDTIQAWRPTTYVVGDDDGWGLTIPMYTWPRGKTFYAGDVLVFKYDYQESNVVVVNRIGYNTCKPNDGAKVYDSGNDKIQLIFGDNFFIGTYNPDDCSAGLKMVVKALSPPSN